MIWRKKGKCNARFLFFISHTTIPSLHCVIIEWRAFFTFNYTQRRVGNIPCSLCCDVWSEERSVRFLTSLSSLPTQHRTRTSHSSLFSSRFNSRSSFVIEAKERDEWCVLVVWCVVVVCPVRFVLHSFITTEQEHNTHHSTNLHTLYTCAWITRDPWP